MPLLVFSDDCWPIFLEGLRQLFVELDPVGCVRKLDYYLPCALDAVSRAASLCIVKVLGACAVCTYVLARAHGSRPN